jgi:DNA (cytosine-5)-methyltransferase 1
LAGHAVEAVAENDLFARSVLASRLPHIQNLGDISSITSLPECDLVACGFPCQDLSSAGGTAGINGSKSGLIRHVLRLLSAGQNRPEWLLLENVPFMLSLNGGSAMEFVTNELEQQGYRWAYRVIDSRAFGLAQRRRRLFLLASRTCDPAEFLFADEGSSREPQRLPSTCCGFYWTEGNRGVGWAIDATPPLKGTSGVAIVSPPAVWRPKSKDFVTPKIEDAEALQGFKRGWTSAARSMPRGERARWRLIGNAVSVPVAKWLGDTLKGMTNAERPAAVRLPLVHKWPNAGFGEGKRRFMVETSEWPGRGKYVGLDTFMSTDAPLLSHRAASGFLKRLENSGLRVPGEFLDDLRTYVAEGRATEARCGDQPENVAHPRPRQSIRKSITHGAFSQGS